MIAQQYIQEVLDTVGPLVKNNIEISAAIVALLAGYTLYVVLGVQYLGADDDFWQALRARLIPALDEIAEDYGLYAETKMPFEEYAGQVQMGEEEFERKLEEARYLRQPLASLHHTMEGKPEAGSWSRPHGPLFPLSEILRQYGVLGAIPGRFLRAIDTILARKQYHIVFFTEYIDGEPYVAVYCHNESNPLNPLVAFEHYRAKEFEAAPEVAREDLAEVGVELEDGADA